MFDPHHYRQLGLCSHFKLKLLFQKFFNFIFLFSPPGSGSTVLQQSPIRRKKIISGSAKLIWIRRLGYQRSTYILKFPHIDEDGEILFSMTNICRRLLAIIMLINVLFLTALIVVCTGAVGCRGE